MRTIFYRRIFMSTRYQIILKGHLDRDWSNWFDGLTITHNGETETILTGTLVDQAALHSLLLRVRDLNLTLIGVSRIEPNEGIL